MASRGILQTIIDEFTWVIKIAISKTSSPDRFVQWMASLGINADLPDGIILERSAAELQDAVDAVSAIDFNRPVEEQIDEYKAPTLELIEAFKAAKELPNSLSVSTELSTGAIAKLVAHDLIASYIELRLPGFYGFFRFLGIIAVEEKFTATNVRYERRTLMLKRLGKLFSDPKGLFRSVYHWGSDPNQDNQFDYRILANQLQTFAYYLGIPARFEPPTAYIHDKLYKDVEDIVDILRIPIYEVADEEIGYAEAGMLFIPEFVEKKPRGVGLIPYVSGEMEQTIPLPEPLELTLSGQFESDLHVQILPNNVNIDALNKNSEVDANFSAELKFGGQTDAMILFGDVETSRFEMQGIYVRLESNVDRDHEFITEFGVNRASLVVKSKDGDGLLQKILPPDGVKADFSFIGGWSSKHGVYIRGSVGLEITIPIQRKFGPIKLESIYLALKLDDSIEGRPPVIEIDIAVTAGAFLGPVTASVKDFGIITTIQMDEDSLEDSKFQFGFKLPSGVAIGLDTEAIRCSGSLIIDEENHLYMGELAIGFGEVGLTATGLITTVMPDGSKGYSIFGRISVEFIPPIALGYGFFLSGVGGILGVHRTLDTEALQGSVQDGSMGSVMFATDPQSDPLKALSDLNKIFPPARDRFIFGPMCKITWGKPALITADIAILVEIPMPIRIALLGRVLAVLPDALTATLVLRFEIAGIIDTEKKMLSIDAVLYDSRIMGIPLIGTMATRARWGNNQMFIMAAGGVDPEFQVPPDFPKLQLLGVCISSGKKLQLNMGCRFAITSNTVQFGASVELSARLGKFGAEGYLRFSALFEFSPFYFRTDIEAGVAITLGSKVLLQADLDFMLEGPKPWHAKGYAKFKIWPITYKKRFDKRIGDEGSRVYNVIDPWEDLQVALSRPESWQGVLPEGSRDSVSLLAHPAAEDEIRIRPNAVIEVRQKIVPLGIPIEKIGNKPTEGNPVFDVMAKSAGPESEAANNDVTELGSEPLEDFFAPSQFQKRSSTNRLKGASYEKMKSGVRLTPQVKNVPPFVRMPLRYEEITIGEDGKTCTREPLKKHLNVEKNMEALHRRNNRNFGIGGRFKTNVTPLTQTAKMSFAVVNSDDLRVQSELMAGSRTQAETIHTGTNNTSELTVVHISEVHK